MNINSLLNPDDNGGHSPSTLQQIVALMGAVDKAQIPSDIAQLLEQAADRLTAHVTGTSIPAHIPTPSTPRRVRGAGQLHTPSTIRHIYPSASPLRPIAMFSPARRVSRPPSPSPAAPAAQTDVKLNRQTRLSKLLTYNDPFAFEEYLETSPRHPVGHLFRRDPENWQKPHLNIAYSLGPPNGQRKSTCGLLVDEGGDEVLCRVYHYTCMSPLSPFIFLCLTVL